MPARQQAAGLSALLLLALLACAGAVSLSRDLTALVRKDDRGIGDFVKDKARSAVQVVKKGAAKIGEFLHIVVNAAKNKLAEFKTAVFDWLDGQRNRCPADKVLIKKSNICRAAEEKKRNDCNLWALAARAAKLSSYAYGDMSKDKHDEVQVLTTISGKSSADAFVSIRARRKEVECMLQPVSRDLSPAERAERDKLWSVAAAVEREQYKVGSGAAPFALEVTVRGTAGLTDILQDLKAKQLDFEVPAQPPTTLGKVHLGFHEQFEALRPAVEAAITPYKQHIVAGRTKLIFAGHSLGGAVCQLLAAYFSNMWNLKKEYEDPRRPMVFTFGSPRVGNHWFSQTMEYDTFHMRFKFGGDIVPEVPPSDATYENFKFGQYEHGATYSIGIGIVPIDSFFLDYRFHEGWSRYIFFCTDECTPFTRRLDLVTQFHSSDMSYATALDMGWKALRDSTFTSTMWLEPMFDWTKHTESQMFAAAGSEAMGDAALTTMRCFGRKECELALQFPGTKPEDRKACVQQLLKTETGKKFSSELKEYDGKDAFIEWMQLTYRRTDAKYDSMSKLVPPYDTCMTAKVVPNYYAGLEPADWSDCKGTVGCIEQRRTQRASK